MQGYKITRSFILLVLCSLLSVGAQAQSGKIKKNNQALIIKLDENGCASGVNLAADEPDNCEGSDQANKCGRNGKDCVCMRPSKFLTWNIENNAARFELDFIGDSPLKPSCAVKSGNNKKIKCKVTGDDGDYDYNVIVEGCPGEAYDPRVVVRR